MRKTILKAGSLLLALGALALFTGRSIVAGCGQSALATAASQVGPHPPPPNPAVYPRYMPATKSAPLLLPPDLEPHVQAQQQAAPRR
jgi:hypothetical protein